MSLKRSIHVALAATAMVFAGGVGAATAKDPIRIVGVTQLASDPFFVTLSCAATKEAAALGAELEWKSIQGIGIPELAAALEGSALLKPDAIILSGNSALSARVGDLMKAGTPIVAVNVPLKPETPYADVVSDMAGSPFADYVVDQVGKDGSVAILGGIAGLPTLQARYQPLIDVLARKAPAIKIIGPEYEKLDRTNAASIASSLILAHPDLKAIYAISGPSGAGVASAVQQMGKAGQIKVFTYDATPEVVQGIVAGTITAAIAQNPSQLGAEAVRIAIDAVKSKARGAVSRINSKNVLLPLKVLTPENIDTPEAKHYFYYPRCQ